MSNITKSVDVEVPVPTAYNQWTQFESFSEFMEGVDEVRQIDDTHTHWVISIGGVTREFDAEITEQHANERVAWNATEGINHAGVVTFHRLDEGVCRVTLQMDVDADGVAEKAAEKSGILGARVQGDLERFKKFIEKRGHPTGAWRGDIAPPRP